MRNILIDIYKTNNLYSGLGQFSLNFAKAILERNPQDISIHLLYKQSAEFDLNADNFQFHKANTLRRFLSNYPNKFDLWHSLHQFPSHLPPKNCKQILTIHDLNFLIEKNDIKKTKYRNRLQKNIRRADAITCISKFTKTMVEQNFDLGNKKIEVIYNGVEANFDQVLNKPAFLNGKKYFFSIGIFNFKKNFHSLIPVLNFFSETQLVLAGNHDTAYGEFVKKEIKRHHLESRVHLLGKVSETEKLSLYANCEAFLFPSLAEGFGIPPIEAMMAGKPVFLSQETSLPEIGGKQAFYFESFEAEKMAELIQTKLKEVEKNPNFSKETKNYAQGFNWEKCISGYIALYQKMV
ncbi:MAG: glycosyltransferase family 4 protein [Flavobacteriales bacterium]|nr:glycosyltransferase family 4 protein [Flavobacteriales bacterium]